MYQSFYGLTRAPFHTTPDPYFLYLSPSHKQALSCLIDALQKRQSLTLLTGEVGTGKTTLLRSFLGASQYSHLTGLFQGIDPETIKTVLVFNPDIAFKNLLRIIYGELGIPLPKLYLAYVSQSGPHITGHQNAASDDQLVAELIKGLHTALVQEYIHGNRVVLIIDEAQNMPDQTLDCLRRLISLQAGQNKLLQIILIGQPELEERLLSEELSRLNQLIAERAYVKPLSREETAPYIEHRLRRAGCKSSTYFTVRASKAVYSYAQGIPRMINTLCDNALIAAYASGKKVVDKGHIKEVIDETGGGSTRRKSPWVMPLSALGLFVLIAIWLSPLPSVIADLWAPWQHELQTHSHPGESPQTTQAKKQSAEPQSASVEPGHNKPAFWLENIQFPGILFAPKDEGNGTFLTQHGADQAETDASRPAEKMSHEGE